MKFATLTLLCVSLAACAPHDTITVRNAWIRAPAPGATIAAGYLDIANSGPTVELIGAESPVAGAVEIHTESHDGGLMQMRRIERLPIPRGQTVSLAPGGTHLMLLQYSGTTRRIPVTLTFSDGSRREVEFEARALDGSRP